MCLTSPVTVYDRYRMLIDETIREFEKKVSNVQKMYYASQDGHKIVGYFIANLVNIVASILHVAVVDRDLTETQLLDLFDYACRKVRELVESYFGKIGRMLLETYLKHVEDRKRQLLETITAELR